MPGHYCGKWSNTMQKKLMPWLITKVKSSQIQISDTMSQLQDSIPLNIVYFPKGGKPTGNIHL